MTTSLCILLVVICIVYSESIKFKTISSQILKSFDVKKAVASVITGVCLSAVFNPHSAIGLSTEDELSPRELLIADRYIIFQCIMNIILTCLC